MRWGNSTPPPEKSLQMVRSPSVAALVPWRIILSPDGLAEIDTGSHRCVVHL